MIVAVLIAIYLLIGLALAVTSAVAVYRYDGFAETKGQHFDFFLTGFLITLGWPVLYPLAWFATRTPPQGGDDR